VRLPKALTFLWIIEKEEEEEEEEEDSSPKGVIFARDDVLMKKPQAEA
jgi:hypothetical protein